MEERLQALRDRHSRTIVGIETGGGPEGRIGAALVDVGGSGNETVLDLHAFRSTPICAELRAALAAFGDGGTLQAEALAQINFLILHQVNSLFFELLESTGQAVDAIDLVGLKGLEAGEREFPDDPGALSETTGCVVASCFRIGPERGGGSWLPVKEALLKGIVGAMIERGDFAAEAGDAVAVALLANESVYHEPLDMPCQGGATRSGGQVPSRTVRRAGAAPGESVLHGEFFFPVR